MAAHAIANFVALENGHTNWLGDGPFYLINVMDSDKSVTMVSNRKVSCETIFYNWSIPIM